LKNSKKLENRRKELEIISEKTRYKILLTLLASETSLSFTRLKELLPSIQENNLNRVIVAACTPRTHEPLFQKTIREAGLNEYLFNFVSIRELDSWVHMNDNPKATDISWLAWEKVHHDVYIIAKKHLENYWQGIYTVEQIGDKNGFIFFKRKK